MKKHVKTGLVLATLLLTPSFAISETILISAPLKGGEGGVICSCTNMTKNNISIFFHIDTYGASSSSSYMDIFPKDTRFHARPYQTPSTCRIIREDRKKVSARKLKCNITSVDINENPMAVLPVDIKIEY